MVEPIGFGSNPETAVDNAFQHPVDASHAAAVARRARDDFGRLAATLEASGVEIVSFQPDVNPAPPDAVFPNNWFSTHPGGTAVLYPLRAENRRRERSGRIRDFLRRLYPRVVDLTAEEDRGRYLEGTGSLVIDESARIAYASVSPRTSPDLAIEWAERFGYRPVVFTSRDGEGRTVYHTNVVMMVATGFAIVCADAIAGDTEREEVLRTLADSGREVVRIRRDQMAEFAANALELEDGTGGRLVALSERAWSALRNPERAAIERHATVIRADVGTIEAHGGGSVRCMLAELY